jgi:hypothetical protein
MHIVTVNSFIYTYVLKFLLFSYLITTKLHGRSRIVSTVSETHGKGNVSGCLSHEAGNDFSKYSLAFAHLCY